jgi:glycosyltransferase involved in cell wall biosynthesis
VDTVDFHYKEFYRKYKITKDPDDLAHANKFLESETTLYKAADTVVVISEDEQEDIQSKILGIRDMNIIPNIHEILESTRPLNKRKNICFLGHFGNKHNVDAVKHFIERIFPLILARNPKVEFHVLGYSAEKYKQVFESPNVRVIGGLKYLEEALAHYKLFVCPMIYGAGMKGKIGSAIAAGLPVVTTSIGAEGFPFRDGDQCFIADSSIEFAEKSNQCLTDPVVWHNFSIKSTLMVAEHYSTAAVAEKLTKLFAEKAARRLL